MVSCNLGPRHFQVPARTQPHTAHPELDISNGQSLLSTVWSLASGLHLMLVSCLASFIRQTREGNPRKGSF